MAFAKRQLTWGEEVFAGLIILVLIIAILVLWLSFSHPLSRAYIETTPQSADVYYPQDDPQPY